MQSRKLRTIKTYNENTKGHDWFVTDLHGNLNFLVELLKKIAPNDRIFMGGDNPDRGEKNLEILYKIHEINEIAGYQRIISIRGNHEDMCLKSISIMQDIIIQYQKLADPKPDIHDYFSDKMSDNMDILSHIDSGGLWLIRLFLQEFLQDDIRVENDEIIYSDESEIAFMQSYFETLPYIIKVGGGNPFNIVHSRLIFSDQELERRIKENIGLTVEEIQQIIWERVMQPSQPNHPSGRNADSNLTYSGHTPLPAGGVCVDANTSTVNTDTGCYATNVIIAINHTLRSASILGDINAIPQQYQKEIIEGKEAIHNYLQSRKIVLRIPKRKAQTQNPDQTIIDKNQSDRKKFQP